MALAQFWAFANDLYTEEQGKRLFPILGIGSSLGALAGSQVASTFFADLRVDRLLLIAGGIIAGSLLLTWRVNRQACSVCAMQRANNDMSLGSRGALEIVSSDRVMPGSGRTPVNLKVSVDPRGLPPGTYNGTLALLAPQAVNSPRTILVQLVVEPGSP
jgi:hypothetical protein